jgi:uncharacterized protein
MVHPEYGDFILGNILDDDLDSTAASGKAVALNDAIQLGVQRCRDECEYFSACGGGAPSNKLFENGSFASTETLYCRLHRKTLIDMVLDNLQAHGDVAAQAEDVAEASFWVVT